MVRFLFVIALLAGVGWYVYPDFQSKEWPPGILVHTEPYQRNLFRGGLHQKGEYAIQELATYQLNARVLDKHHYSEDLSPYDLALGWQQMSDSALLDRLDITQYARFYHYEWQGESPIDPSIIARTSANTHMIPANDAVLQTLKKIHKGDLIHLEGFLVHVNGPNGWSWQSSMTRDDQGAGACEVVWVESITILNAPPG